MAMLGDVFPLGTHRARVARYLRGIVLPAASVAGTIIKERLSAAYGRDPLPPTLVLWACEAVGGDVADALPVAGAFDLFNRFLLLHAELTNESASSVARWGLGQSLNAGDAFYALAFRTLAGDVANPQRRLNAARIVATAVLDAIDESDQTRRDAGLTSAALRAGTVIGGAREGTVRAFARAGRLLFEEPMAAVAALRSCTSANDLAAFEEVARYVAQRAA
jgi:hypothetical protein